MEDIVKKIDKVLVNELFPAFFAGVSSMKGKSSNIDKMDPIMRELISKVIYCKEKDHMKAIDMIAKDENLSKKRVKELKKFFKKYGGK